MIRVFFLVFLVAASSLGSPIAPRIIGGSAANIADFPYTVSIESQGFGHYCGGVIVSANWVLTDAWCTFTPIIITKFTIRSGSAILENGTVHKATRWIHHPQNDLANSVNDFALVQVDPPFEFGENVAAVTLPTQNQETPDGAQGVFTGWGGQEDGATVTATLQYARVTVSGEAACADILALDYDNSKLCAQDPNGVVARCYRDEGGPLVVDGTLFGIVLFPGNSCSDPLAVQIFGRVASVRDWIDSTIGV